MKTYWIYSTDLVLGSTPKVASLSINTSIARHSARCKSDWLKLHRDEYFTILFVRHPVNRLKSAYSFFENLATQYPDEKLPKSQTFPRFVDNVLSGEYPNIHWTSQSEQHTYNGVFLPHEVWRFESLQSWWQKRLPDIPLAYKHKSNSSSVLDYKVDEIEMAYSDDMELYTNGRN